jgi:hypothetical protein
MQPYMTVTPKAAPSGGTVVVSGRSWSTGCHDTVSCADGGPCARDPKAPSRSAVTVLFTQGTISYEYGSTTVGPDQRFTYEVQVPEWASTGAATFHADEVITGFRVTGATAARPAAGGGVGSTAADLAAGDPLPKTGAPMPSGQALALAGAALALALAARRAAPAPAPTRS